MQIIDSHKNVIQSFSTSELLKIIDIPMANTKMDMNESIIKRDDKCHGSVFNINTWVEAYNRKVVDDIFSSDLKTICDALDDQLPSIKWIHDQNVYSNTLSVLDKKFIKLYTKDGDVVLNAFIRNNFTVTNNEIQFISRHYDSFEDIMNRYDTLANFLIHFYSSINRIIDNAPKTHKSFVLYRGEKNAHQSCNPHDSMYLNRGVMSSSISSKVAIKYSRNRAHKKFMYVTRILVPEGSRCFYINKNLSVWKSDEEEIIFPDQAQFKCSDYRSVDYLYASSPIMETTWNHQLIQTNELLLRLNAEHEIHEKSVLISYDKYGLIDPKDITQSDEDINDF